MSICGGTRQRSRHRYDTSQDCNRKYELFAAVGTFQRISDCQNVPAGQVRYGGNRRSSASPRLPCDGTSLSSVWPSPRQTPRPPCLHPSDRTLPDATMKLLVVPALSAYSISYSRSWNPSKNWILEKCQNALQPQSCKDD